MARGSLIHHTRGQIWTWFDNIGYLATFAEIRDLRYNFWLLTSPLIEFSIFYVETGENLIFEVGPPSVKFTHFYGFLLVSIHFYSFLLVALFSNYVMYDMSQNGERESKRRLQWLMVRLDVGIQTDLLMEVVTSQSLQNPDKSRPVQTNQDLSTRSKKYPDLGEPCLPFSYNCILYIVLQANTIGTTPPEIRRKGSLII